MSRLFIRLLVLVCLAIVGWTAWVFFHGGATLINGVVLAVDIAVLVWNFWVMKKMHIGFGSVILTGVIIAIVAIPATLAYANIDNIKSWGEQTFNKANGQVAEVSEQAPNKIKEQTNKVASGMDSKLKEQIGKPQTYVFEEWEYKLNSYKLTDTTATISLTITSQKTKPSSPNADIILIDQYGIIYYPQASNIRGEEAAKQAKEDLAKALFAPDPNQSTTYLWYPGDSKTGSITFPKNSKSGNLIIGLKDRNGLRARIFVLEQK
jgi:hypothetical protein